MPKEEKRMRDCLRLELAVGSSCPDCDSLALRREEPMKIICTNCHNEFQIHLVYLGRRE